MIPFTTFFDHKILTQYTQIKALEYRMEGGPKV